ncbi:uncharacterized protein BJ212DRAFT_1300909 [Suillus subaureus]|uniref:Uncharacterized protein n=1 Tax=Suillus subaureus TaxID=48587 RepID=A0A9P7E8D8_9AGAM|nr:uncharacterized protein BJ212DRAFT_1300909 [Suillus subaureus]KAG1813494.1 hypothetical protein BJ212DRAFT_1300909 [Suillus subaureus]
MAPCQHAPKTATIPAPTVPIPTSVIHIPTAVIPVPVDAIPVPAGVIPIPVGVIPIPTGVIPTPVTIVPIPLPRRYQDFSHSQPMVDEGECFDLDNVSGDDDDEEYGPPAPTIRAPAAPSPLQTAAHNDHPTQTTLLDTGSLMKKAKGTDDFHFFFRLDEVTGCNTCIPCE